ncbi:MAG: hypothetical protein L6Q84_24160 [Polyangiaceae bacterium]|nr:hypothetical protein [Polyangiaceae bacterium]
MAGSHADYLLERIDRIRSARTDVTRLWDDEDVEDVVLEAAEYVRDALDLPRMERELIAGARPDTGALAQVLTVLQAAAKVPSPPFAMRFADGQEFDWRVRLKRLKTLVTGLAKAEQLEELEVALRVSFVGDLALEGLLMALAPDSEIRKEVASHLQKKLELLTDQQVEEFWAKLRREIDPSTEVHLELDSAVVKSSFFDFPKPKAARKRIAEYVSRVRPLLARRALERDGTASLPTGTAGPATILCWTSTPSTRTWSATDRVITRSVGRLAACWADPESEELARALGLRSAGYFFGGRADRESRRSLGSSRETAPSARALEEMAKLLQIAAQRRGRPEGAVERTLRAYKLGLEVVGDSVRADMLSKGELALQRDLCRFLVERDIPAFGTKFGSSEVDLLVEDDLGPLVVEVKKLQKLPTEGRLGDWLTQLGSYMDQQHSAVRGALVLFNFADGPVLAPVVPVVFRYLIVSINLCGVTPSRRQSHVEIRPSASSPGFELISIGQPSAARPTSRRRQTAASTKARRRRQR